MSSQQEDFYNYWICSIAGIGNKKISALKSELGSAWNVYNATDKDISDAMRRITAGETKVRVKFVKHDLDNIIEGRNSDNIYNNYNNLRKKGISFTYPEKADYPNKLKNIYDVPQIIFWKGRLPNQSLPGVAIIGTRNSSLYGKQIAQLLGEQLLLSGVQIISGMALGIDAYGLDGAIRGIEAGVIDRYNNELESISHKNADYNDILPAAYAVLGSGVDVCYPAFNIELYARLLENGGVISEYMPGTRPAPGNFPMRNRIISGLADIVIVVEARMRSGSLITVNHALEQGKEVMAVPGRIGDAASEGCNYLLHQGAHVVTKVEDVLDIINGIMPKFNAAVRTVQNELEDDALGNFSQKLYSSLGKNEQKVYDVLGYEPVSLNYIIERTGIMPGELMEALLNLELINIAEEEPSNYYRKRQ